MKAIMTNGLKQWLLLCIIRLGMALATVGKNYIVMI